MGIDKKCPNCPLCDEVLLCDSNVAEYCALCSMTIRQYPVKTIKLKQGTKFFCSEKCCEKFEEFCSK